MTTTTERDRPFDEKFRILQAPSLFRSDLRTARKDAELRDVVTAVAYVDIDKFKDFNSTHGEPKVDRQFLPQFMRVLEAHVFMRGHAYRFGGDEYMILLYNVTETEAYESFNRLRRNVAKERYEIGRAATISTGVILVDPACYLTESEIESAAAAAKQSAKAAGRDKVFAYPLGSYGPASKDVTTE